MSEVINPEVENRLSHINARLADEVELLHTSTTTIKHSSNIIYGLESEIEELYLSLGIAKDESIDFASDDTD